MSPTHAKAVQSISTQRVTNPLHLLKTVLCYFAAIQAGEAKKTKTVFIPTKAPITKTPTRQPSYQPTYPTLQPSFRPSTTSPTTLTPSQMPTPIPTLIPTEKPSCQPTSPTVTPSTIQPTYIPTIQPTYTPTTVTPTLNPTIEPTLTPTTLFPTNTPTLNPTIQPTYMPTTDTPTLNPTSEPTLTPTTLFPTNKPTLNPTIQPTYIPTTDTPTLNPTSEPTLTPTTLFPTHTPTLNPTSEPTLTPTTLFPTHTPTQSPTISTFIPTTDTPTISTFMPTTDAPTASTITQNPTTQTMVFIDAQITGGYTNSDCLKGMISVRQQEAVFFEQPDYKNLESQSKSLFSCPTHLPVITNHWGTPINIVVPNDYYAVSDTDLYLDSALENWNLQGQVETVLAHQALYGSLSEDTSNVERWQQPAIVLPNTFRGVCTYYTVTDARPFPYYNPMFRGPAASRLLTNETFTIAKDLGSVTAFIFADMHFTQTKDSKQEDIFVSSSTWAVQAYPECGFFIAGCCPAATQSTCTVLELPAGYDSDKYGV